MKIKKGFTLVELLVVLTLVSAMLMVMTTQYRHVIQDWQDKKSVREAHQLIKLYRLTGSSTVQWQWLPQPVMVSDPSDNDEDHPADQLIAGGMQDDDAMGDDALNDDDDGSDELTEEEPVVVAAAFADKSKQKVAGLATLRDRLLALPDAVSGRHLTRSVVDGSDPVTRYGLVTLTHSQALDIKVPLHNKPHGAVPLSAGQGIYRLHHRLRSPDYLTYVLPALVERNAFNLEQQP